MRRRLVAIMLSVISVLMLSIPVLADGDTVLTTTVPAAVYTLNIPENQEIPFGTTNKEIGNITVTDASGFAVGKDLKVTVSYEPFKSTDVSSTIPYSLWLRPAGSSGIYDLGANGSCTFPGKSDGSVYERADIKSSGSTTYSEAVSLQVSITADSWGKALAGDYSSTITFTSEVVLAD